MQNGVVHITSHSSRSLTTRPLSSSILCFLCSFITSRCVRQFFSICNMLQPSSSCKEIQKVRPNTDRLVGYKKTKKKKHSDTLLKCKYLKRGHLKLTIQNTEFLATRLYTFEYSLLELLFFCNHEVQQTLKARKTKEAIV